MEKPTKMIDGQRRSFLRQSAVVSGAVVAGSALTPDSAQASELVSPEPPTQKGYSESDHVKAYYQRERFF